MVEASERPGRGDRTVARLPGACLIAIALYAVVALVLVPEGEPSPDARLLALGSIVTLSIVAVAVARWAPAWVRGLGMLVVGFGALAVLLGVVAERLARSPSARTILGLVAGAAGVLLVVVGWQRLLARLHRGWLKVTTAVVGTLVVLQMLLLPAVVALLVTNRARPQASGRTPADAGLAFEDVRIPMVDGVELAAWWIPSGNGAAVIVIPGSGSTRDDVIDHAAFVAEAGYGALLLDVRGHGDSGGRLMDLGWGAERDIAEVVSWLEAQRIDRIGLSGLSMGGEIALTAAAEDPRVDAVVAEGATGRTYRDSRLVPESNPVAHAVGWTQFAMIGALAPEAEPIPLIDAVARIDAPVLLIEGAGPLEEEVGPLFDDAAPDTFALWAIPDAPHVGGLSARGDEYRARVLAVFDQAL